MSLLLLLVSPDRVRAFCQVGICTTQGVSCNVNSTNYCCRGDDPEADCEDLKISGSLEETNNRGILVTDPTDGCPNSSDDNPQIYTGLGCIPTSTKGFTEALLTFLAGTAGAISLIVMLIATIQIMTGGDNAEQVKKGKELFTGAVTGLLFIVFSVTLLQIVAGGIIKLPGFTK